MPSPARYKVQVLRVRAGAVQHRRAVPHSQIIHQLTFRILGNPDIHGKKTQKIMRCFRSRIEVFCQTFLNVSSFSRSLKLKKHSMIFLGVLKNYFVEKNSRWKLWNFVKGSSHYFFVFFQWMSGFRKLVGE